jgi:hypothetical protein
VEQAREARTSVDHRHISELEKLVIEFEGARNGLIEGLKEFNPRHFR